MPEVAQLIEAINRGKGAKFASFTYRAKGTGELAKVTIVLGASTESLYKRDLAALEIIHPTLTGLELEACAKIMASRRESLEKGIGNNSAYTNADTYVYPVGLSGIRVHKETGALYVNGLIVDKKVIEPGTYKEVKSRPLTLARNAIEKNLPSSKYRMYTLPNVLRAALNGEVLEFDVAD